MTTGPGTPTAGPTLPGSKNAPLPAELADADADATPMLDGARGERAVQAFLQLARAWLTAPDRGPARLMLLALLALTIAQVAVQIRLNLWNRDFFNALESRDGPGFQYQILLFLGLAAMSMSVGVYHLYIKQLTQLRWRQWLSAHLIGAWLRDGRHYQLEMAGSTTDNPDQRIADDARIATDLSVDFVTGVLTAVSMLAAFSGILWTLSGTLPFVLFGSSFEVPGYMVWAAVGYALIGTLFAYLIGRPLVGLNIRRSTAEGDFRFGLSRARESGEGIALIRGEEDERRGLADLFTEVAARNRGVMRGQRNLMWLTTGYAALALVFPALVASPLYFAGAITLGGLMQIVGAFGQVQASLSWLVDNFPRIAEWRGAVGRIVAFGDAVEALDTLIADPAQPTIAIREGAPDVLIFRDLEVAFANGTTVIAEASAEIAAGERVLIRGESGTGKSTLFRAIGGLWPWGAGEIVTPPREDMMFMPQRPYLPLGTLRGALAYPAAPDHFPDADIQAALERVGLGKLAPELGREDRWDRTLSLGEQQRLGFARLLLQRPAWIFMDEATAALDEANQDAMMQLVLDALPGSALVSIGHRPGLDAFHTRSLTLQRAKGGARLTRVRRAPVQRQWSRPAPRFSMRPVRG